MVLGSDGQGGGGDDAGADPTTKAALASVADLHDGQRQGVRGAHGSGRGAEGGTLLRAVEPLLSKPAERAHQRPDAAVRA